MQILSKVSLGDLHVTVKWMHEIRQPSSKHEEAPYVARILEVARAYLSPRTPLADHSKEKGTEIDAPYERSEVDQLSSAETTSGLEHISKSLKTFFRNTLLLLLPYTSMYLFYL